MCARADFTKYLCLQPDVGLLCLCEMLVVGDCGALIYLKVLLENAEEVKEGKNIIKNGSPDFAEGIHILYQVLTGPESILHSRNMPILKKTALLFALKERL